MKSIDKSTLKFLEDLKNNNNRDWFNDHKTNFLDAQKKFIDFIDHIIVETSQFDESIEKLEAKNCIFRIYKDIRFSKDKTPYKSNMGASLKSKGTKTLSNPGYYIHLEPGKSFIGGGVYMTEPQNLKAIRQKISDNPDDFFKIINHKNFKSILKLEGDKLVRVPQGFDKDDPMAEFLKYKQFTYLRNITDDELLSENAVDIIVNTFKEIYPFNQFLDEAINKV